MHRVLHLISGLGSGGAQKVLARLVRATQARWEHYVVSLSDPAGSRPVNLPPHVNVELMGLRLLRDLPRVLMRVRHAAKIFDATIVQGWMYHGNLLASTCRFHMRHVPVIWSIRHSTEGQGHHPLGTRLVVAANAMLSPTAHSIIFNSARSLALHANAGFATQGAILIPNGFDTEIFSRNLQRGRQWRAERGIPPDALVFGHAARFHPVKNHGGALQAFLQLAAERSDVRLVMVGADVSTAESLRGLAATHPCRDRAMFIDEQSEMPDFYNAIDVFLLSSLAEAMPNVVGEAMACGRPCVATDVGDARVLVGETGWIVPGTGSEELLKSMRMACDAGRVQIDALGARARLRIEEQFSLGRMVAQYEQLYDSLHAARSSAQRLHPRDN